MEGKQMFPRADVAGGAVAGAITTLLLVVLQWGDWSGLDWTAISSAFTVLFASGLGYVAGIANKEAVTATGGALAFILVGVIQTFALGTPFDIPVYASAISALVTFAITYVLPRVQPFTE